MNEVVVDVIIAAERIYPLRAIAGSRFLHVFDWPDSQSRILATHIAVSERKVLYTFRLLLLGFKVMMDNISLSHGFKRKNITLHPCFHTGLHIKRRLRVVVTNASPCVTLREVVFGY